MSDRIDRSSKNCRSSDSSSRETPPSAIAVDSAGAAAGAFAGSKGENLL